MTIAIAGKNSIAIDIAKYVAVNFSDLPLLVVANRTDDGCDGFQPSFLRFAQSNALKIVDLAYLYQIENLLFISLEFDRIIKPENFMSDNLFNIHFSKLPAYKGMYTSALPIFNGEAQTGVTFHRIDRGIDTGDIIAQKVFDITDTDTARSLYHKYLAEGTLLVKSVIQDLISNNYSTRPQSMIGSTYNSKSSIDYSNIVYNLNDTAWSVSCQIRAFIFREYQMPTILGHQIARVEILDIKSRCKAGSIVAQDEFSAILSTIDYDIVLCFDLFAKLIDCCRNDDAQQAEVLLTKSTDTEERTKQGWTPLMVAAYNGSLNVVRVLLAAGADANATNYKGTSVLMYAKDGAIKTGDFAILKMLVEVGVDVKWKDYSGRDVLNYVENEDENVFNFLKEL